jgi:myo-inositol-1(or 4)-monophosphatase
VLVSEAGGRVTDYTGGRFRADAGQCLASNGLIHDEMLAVLKEVRALSAHRRR